MKLNELLKDFYNKELSEHLSWPTYRRKAEKYLNDNEIDPRCALSVVSGWLMVSGNESLFNKQAKKNCRVLFDDGTECRYNDKHPNAVLTHFKID